MVVPDFRNVVITKIYSLFLYNNGIRFETVFDVAEAAV